MELLNLPSNPNSMVLWDEKTGVGKLVNRDEVIAIQGAEGIAARLAGEAVLTKAFDAKLAGKTITSKELI